MSITRTIYLLLAIFGLVMTWYYNLQFIAESAKRWATSRIRWSSVWNFSSLKIL